MNSPRISAAWQQKKTSPCSSTGPAKRLTKPQRKNYQCNTRGFALRADPMDTCRNHKCPNSSSGSTTPRPTSLFLALGSPKQEKWFAGHAHELEHVKVCQGIGGTLDTIAGTVRRAPDIWQRFSAEWLYRLLSEPKRIGRQKVLPIFAFRVLMTMAKSSR